MASPSPALPGVFKISVSGSMPSADAVVQSVAVKASRQVLKSAMYFFIVRLLAGLLVSLLIGPMMQVGNANFEVLLLRSRFVSKSS